MQKLIHIVGRGAPNVHFKWLEKLRGCIKEVENEL